MCKRFFAPVIGESNFLERNQRIAREAATLSYQGYACSQNLIDPARYSFFCDAELYTEDPLW
jgi:hypothetical protein